VTGRSPDSSRITSRSRAKGFQKPSRLRCRRCRVGLPVPTVATSSRGGRRAAWSDVPRPQRSERLRARQSSSLRQKRGRVRACAA
jgi:hypothetical protein